MAKLKIGDVVRIKPQQKGRKEWNMGKITKVVDKRSYQILSNGSQIRRNRRDLIKTNEKFQENNHDYEWVPNEANEQNVAVPSERSDYLPARNEST